MDIPKIELNNGVKIPCIGNGPGIVGYSPRQDRISNSLFKRAFRKFIIRPKQEYDYVDAVANSFKIGFSLLDYSSSYGDGHLIGKAIKRSGVSRNDLFITTRISNQAQREQKVRACLMSQLQGMGVDYVDMLMFHWPVTDLYIDTWKEMVQLYKEGYCKCLGVANCHNPMRFIKCYLLRHFTASLPAIRPNTVPIVIPNPPIYPCPRTFPEVNSPAAKIFLKGVPSCLSTRACLSSLRLR